MTEFIRSAKCGRDWTTYGLAAYNITVEDQDATTFFGTDNLPQPTVHPALLTASAYGDAADVGVAELLIQMDRATRFPPASSVVDFVPVLLRAMGCLNTRGFILQTRQYIPLVICGENRDAQTDASVCLFSSDRWETLLLVQEDKQHRNISDPAVPQLVAKAIGAFAENNVARQEGFNLPPLDSRIMAGITMKGTAPVFYKIRVTTALVASVMGGVYPQDTTTVYAHIPDTPRPDCRSEGMKPLDNREAILSCFEAFKQFASQSEMNAS